MQLRGPCGEVGPAAGLRRRHSVAPAAAGEGDPGAQPEDAGSARAPLGWALGIEILSGNRALSRMGR